MKNFITEQKGFVPIDFDKVMKDKYYLSIIKRLRTQRGHIISMAVKCLNENRRILNLITDELKESD